MLFGALKTVRLKSIPGEVYAYSNFATGLLGVILERVGGLPFDELVRQIITQPMDMDSTAQHLPPRLNKHFVSVYNKWGLEAKHWDFDAMAGCGCLKSSVDDLLAYAQSHINADDDLPGRSLALTREVSYNKNAMLGLAWHVFKLNGLPYYWHNGGTYGCSSFLLFNVERRVALVVLSNAAVSCDQLAISILKKLN